MYREMSTGNEGAVPSLPLSHLKYLTPDGRDAEIPAQLAGTEARAVAHDIEVICKFFQAVKTTLHDDAATTLKP